MPRAAGKPSRKQDEVTEAHWPASLAVVAALLLYVTLPARLVVGPRWVLPALEATLLVPLILPPRRRHHTDPPWIRGTSIGLIALVNAANVVTLALLASFLVSGGHQDPDLGRELILSALEIWLTNVLIFGLWYWEIDCGGPTGRTRDDLPPPDFLFPQTTQPDFAPAGWRPNFLDYLYVSFTNATAFSPTDTMPLTTGAKALMAVQSFASLLTVGLVAARAVNILS